MKRLHLHAVLIFLLLACAASTAHAQTVISLAGLNASVEILRDDWGIPHIYASTTHDLFFAQGYTQAQDRWWQMELFRHVGNGTVSELVGNSALGADIFNRTLGWRQTAERELATTYDADTLAVLQAFADGVNAFILNHRPDELAMEYPALATAGVKIAVEPWTPADTLVWGKVITWNQSSNESLEPLFSQLYKALGKDMVDQFVPPYPYGKKPTILFPEDLPITDASQTSSPDTIADTAGIIGISTQYAGNISPSTQIGSGEGSNNWVVSGSLSASGKPLLANDPHLGIQMPSIWYEIGLHCQPVSAACPFDVTGFAFAPAPGVVIGHNAHIAWGLTNAEADTQDLYTIKVNPANPLQYQWNGTWRNMTMRDEEFRFGDGKPSVKVQVRETHLGPIINDNQLQDGTSQGFNNVDPLALRWTASEPGKMFEALLKVNQAANWQDFRAALRDWDSPVLNFVYADTEGNIGYQLPGHLPIRAQGHTGILPVDGSTDQYEWQGYIPFDDLPRIYNPKRGFIATANQAIVPAEYYDQLAAKLGSGHNYQIGVLTAWGYRAQRIVELLTTLPPHTVTTFQTIQTDNKNLSAAEILPFLAKVHFDDPKLTAARDWLLTWDDQMLMNSPQAALYAEFWSRLVSNLYNDQLSGRFTANGNDNELWATYLLMQDPTNVWWDDLTTKDKIETREDILVRSFQEGYAAAVRALGDDQGKWMWGTLHTATFINDPLGSSGVPLAESLVNRGPVPVSGGGEIINATAWNAGEFTVTALPSMRMIVDLSDLTRSVTMHTTGESGHPGDAHYDDMITPWRTFQYHPMLWTRAQVEAAAASSMVLNPAK